MIKFISCSKIKINIGGYDTENKYFYEYYIGIRWNIDSSLKSLLDFKRRCMAKTFILPDRVHYINLKRQTKFRITIRNDCKD